MGGQIRNPLSFGHRALSLAALLLGVNACVTGRLGPTSQERTWPAYLGSSARSGSAGETLSSDPQPVWRVVLARGIAGSPALAEDVVAVAQVDMQVALLDRATGEVMWRRRLGTSPGAGPLLVDNRVYVGTQGRDGTVQALRLTDGARQWSVNTGDVAAPLALHGGAIYAVTSQGWVYALDAERGGQRWRSRAIGGVRSAPVPVPGGVIVATGFDSLLLLDAETGAVRERRGTEGAVLGAAALDSNRLVFGTVRGRLEIVDVTTLATLWSQDAGSPIVGTIAIRERRAFALTSRGVLWTIPLDRPADASSVDLAIVARAGPAPVAGGVFVAGIDGLLIRVDSTGARRWSVRVRSPVIEPVLVDGSMLFVVSQRGEMVAFR